MLSGEVRPGVKEMGDSDPLCGFLFVFIYFDCKKMSTSASVHQKHRYRISFKELP